MSHQSATPTALAPVRAWRRLAAGLVLGAISLSGCGLTVGAGAASPEPAGQLLDKGNIKSVLTSSLDHTTFHTTARLDYPRKGQIFRTQTLGVVDSSGAEMRLTLDSDVFVLDGSTVVDTWNVHNLRSLPGALYVNLTEFHGMWSKLDPVSDDQFAPTYFRRLKQTSPQTQVGDMLASLTSVAFKGTETHDGEQWDKYEVVIDPHTAYSAMNPSLPVLSVPASVTESVWVDKKGRPRKLQFGFDGTSMALEFSSYDEKVDIAAPPASLVSNKSFGELLYGAPAPS